jgi:hypothetical protein
MYAARHRREEWAQHILRFCADAGVTGSPLRSEPSREPTQEQVDEWHNQAVELSRDEILSNPACAPFHALHQRHFAALAYAAGQAERDRLRELVRLMMSIPEMTDEQLEELRANAEQAIRSGT